MPTKQLMIQISFEDNHFLPVTMIPQLGAAVLMKLNPHKTTVVREITAHEFGCVVGLNLLDLNMPGAFFSPRVRAEALFETTVDGENFLLAPSSLPSPPFVNTSSIRLAVVQAPITAPPGGAFLAEFVGGGGHVYVDQIS
jgi:hypothetical protein